MPKHIVYERDLAKGVAVNLLWGGKEQVGHQGTGSFGYSKDGSYKQLFEANNQKKKDTMVADPVVTITVDMDASTFDIHFNGKTYADLPFDNKVSIDTIRFVAHLAGSSGLPKSSIDDVVIRKGK